MWEARFSWADTGLAMLAEACLRKHMSITIILNPNAGTAGQRSSLFQTIEQRPDITYHVTQQPGQGATLAAEALAAGSELVVAAGGDGTVNEVVNGLAADFRRARLGIIPLGTGNDLARTLAIPADPLEAFELLAAGTERAIDVIQVETAGKIIYGVNMAIGGFTGQMNERLTDELKSNWGPLSYLIGAVQVMPDLTEYQTTITWEDGTTERLTTLNIAVANGRTAAGGFRVAPRANPEDGLLDVIVVRYDSLPVVAEVATRFVAGTYLEHEQVHYRRTPHVHVASRPGMWFNLDGELLTNEPITCAVLPQALRTIVGPAYAATV
jgi:diacylglycerol kinase (ATP)